MSAELYRQMPVIKNLHMKRSIDFKPSGPNSMADRVEDNLRKHFQRNAFKPGHPLHGELEIAEQLQVNRNLV